jgi:carboxylesterase type B
VVAGRLELAERAFRRAIDLSDRGGLRTPATWARIRLAELLRSSGTGADEAAALLDEARATATELGLGVAASAARG